MKIFKLLLFILIALSYSCKNDIQESSDLEEDIYFEDYESPREKWGYINPDGKLIINASFDDCRDFKDGLAMANYKGKWGYIDKSGKTIIDHKYRSVHEFSDGLAKVQNFAKKYGFIDRSGNELIPFDIVSAVTSSLQNLSCIELLFIIF